MSLSETVTDAGIVLNATSAYQAWKAVQIQLHLLKDPELEKVLVKDLDPEKPWTSLTPEEKSSYETLALFFALEKSTKKARKSHKPKTSGFFLFSGEQRVKAQNAQQSIPLLNNSVSCGLSCLRPTRTSTNNVHLPSLFLLLRRQRFLIYVNNVPS